MGYLEIILLGLMINLVIFVMLTITIIILVVVENVTYPFESAKSVIILEDLTRQIKNKRDTVPIDDKYNFGGTMVIFPFIYVFEALYFFTGILNHGVYGWFIYKAQKELDRLDHINT